jgi:hypothetical protein
MKTLTLALQLTKIEKTPNDTVGGYSKKQKTNVKVVKV